MWQAVGARAVSTVGQIFAIFYGTGGERSTHSGEIVSA